MGMPLISPRVCNKSLGVNVLALVREGFNHPAAGWGPSPVQPPPGFSRARARSTPQERDLATQPPQLAPCLAKSWPLQAFKSEKICPNAERGVSLIGRGTAEAPRQARWVPRARPAWDHAGFAPRCRFSFPRSPADVPVSEKGLGRGQSSPGTGVLPSQLKPHRNFCPFLG